MEPLVIGNKGTSILCFEVKFKTDIKTDTLLSKQNTVGSSPARDTTQSPKPQWVMA